MDSGDLLDWISRSLALLQSDVHLLKNDLSERCITAKLGCYLHCQLNGLVSGNDKLPSDQRWHVDCEYNKWGDDTKWFPWEHPIIDETKTKTYYTPIPDIILHKRGAGGPNELVIEAKKDNNVNPFLELIDRLKLIGYLGPNMNYDFGLYLCLGENNGNLVVKTADLIEKKTVNEAMKGKGDKPRKHAMKLVNAELRKSGKVVLCHVPNSQMKSEAKIICSEIIEAFSFVDVRERIKATQEGSKLK